MTEFKAAVPVLPVSAIAPLAAFYEAKLDFDILHQDDGYAVLQRDRIQIHLWCASDESWKNREPGKPIETGAETFLAGTASCRVHVSEIEALYELCKECGIVHPNGPLSDKPYGLREFAVLDPDNNLITFFRPIEASDG